MSDLQKAKDSLKIIDLYLHESESKHFNDFDPKYAPEELLNNVEGKHLVRASQVVEVDGEQILRVFIDFGMRWMRVDESLSEAERIQSMIEASFVAEYLITEPLEEASIKAFALKNASYHAWPYWREYFMSQCQRMRLPVMALPTVQLAENRHHS